MAPIRDPEGVEVASIIRFAQLSNRDVLEIGCGKGDITRQYIELTHRVLGIDPLLVDIKEAHVTQHSLPKQAHFSQAMGEKLPFPAGMFDVVLFTSSL